MTKVIPTKLAVEVIGALRPIALNPEVAKQPGVGNQIRAGDSIMRHYDQQEKIASLDRHGLPRPTVGTRDQISYERLTDEQLNELTTQMMGEEPSA